MNRLIKSGCSFLLSKSRHPIVVSSMGRSGSTMLTKAILHSLHKYNTVKDLRPGILKKWIDGLPPKYMDRVVYKTHDYPPRVTQSNVKYVYTYDSPINVVSSLYRKKKKEGEDWLRRHALHMKSSPKKAKEFLKYDAFGLEKHFDAWRSASDIEVALVRFDKLWEMEDKLSGYLGVDLNLPKKRERRSSFQMVPKDRRGKVKKIYSNLEKKVSEMEFKIRTD